MPRNAGDYVKSWGAALIRGAASNPEFTVVIRGLPFVALCHGKNHDLKSTTGKISVMSILLKFHHLCMLRCFTCGLLDSLTSKT